MQATADMPDDLLEPDDQRYAGAPFTGLVCPECRKAVARITRCIKSAAAARVRALSAWLVGDGPTVPRRG
jgi:hypothetical protein